MSHTIVTGPDSNMYVCSLGTANGVIKVWSFTCLFWAIKCFWIWVFIFCNSQTICNSWIIYPGIRWCPKPKFGWMCSKSNWCSLNTMMAVFLHICLQGLYFILFIPNDWFRVTKKRLFYGQNWSRASIFYFFCKICACYPEMLCPMLLITVRLGFSGLF